jgi:hypothetical protein
VVAVLTPEQAEQAAQEVAATGQQRLPLRRRVQQTPVEVVAVVTTTAQVQVGQGLLFSQCQPEAIQALQLDPQQSQHLVQILLLNLHSQEVTQHESFCKSC